MIIDFEGEPARSIAERRLKQSPLRDVAGMLRSFHYATGASLDSLAAAESAQTPTASSAGRSAARASWARVWHLWSSAAFLRAYLAQTAGALFLPRQPQELAWLLDQFLLEKAVYELRYELNNRPDWLPIPLGSGARPWPRPLRPAPNALTARQATTAAATAAAMSIPNRRIDGPANHCQRRHGQTDSQWLPRPTHR